MKTPRPWRWAKAMSERLARIESNLDDIAKAQFVDLQAQRQMHQRVQADLNLLVQPVPRLPRSTKIVVGLTAAISAVVLVHAFYLDAQGQQLLSGATSDRQQATDEIVLEVPAATAGDTTDASKLGADSIRLNVLASKAEATAFRQRPWVEAEISFGAIVFGSLIGWGVAATGDNYRRDKERISTMQAVVDAFGAGPPSSDDSPSSQDSDMQR